MVSNVGNTLLQFFGDKECTVKLGFQIANERTDKRINAAIKGTVDTWFENGDIAEGEVLIAYMKVGHVQETETPEISGFTRLDGTEVESASSAASADAADTPY